MRHKLASMFLVLSFLLISTQPSISQPFVFDFTFGSFGSGDGQFFIPLGIAVDNMQNIYVVDSNNRRIQVFDSSGNFQFMFGWGVNDGANEFQICTNSCQAGSSGNGDGQFNFPFGIALDTMNNIYVADVSNNRVQVFDSSGNFLFTFGEFGTGDGQFFNPNGVAVDNMKNIYVADTNNHRVQVFDSSGNFLFGFGTSLEGELTFPADIAVDSMKNIYVADPVNDRVQVYSSSGNFLFTFGEFGTGDGQFDQPTGIAVDSMKNIYVADRGNNRVQVFDSSGNFLLTFGEFGTGDGEFVQPQGIAVDSMKNIYVTDNGNNNRVQVFSLFQRNVPTLSEWGLIAMAGILGLVGFMVIRRRNALA